MAQDLAGTAGGFDEARLAAAGLESAQLRSSLYCVHADACRNSGPRAQAVASRALALAARLERVRLQLDLDRAGAAAARSHSLRTVPAPTRALAAEGCARVFWFGRHPRQLLGGSLPEVQESGLTPRSRRIDFVQLRIPVGFPMQNTVFVTLVSLLFLNLKTENRPLDGFSDAQFSGSGAQASLHGRTRSAGCTRRRVRAPCGPAAG